MRRCDKCEFWVPWRISGVNKGECHRYPKRTKPLTGELVYPPHAGFEWCGEFKEKEE